MLRGEHAERLMKYIHTPKKNIKGQSTRTKIVMQTQKFQFWGYFKYRLYASIGNTQKNWASVLRWSREYWRNKKCIILSCISINLKWRPGLFRLCEEGNLVYNSTKRDKVLWRGFDYSLRQHFLRQCKPLISTTWIPI